MTITQADFEDAARKTAILQRELDITNADHIALWLEASRPLDNALSWLACRIIEAHEIEVAKAVKAAETRAREEGAKAMQWPEQWPLGTRVRKRKGSSWQGRVVGYYSTHLTPRGYAVESERETGSVQIYPKAALEVIDPAQIAGGGK